MKCFHIAHFAIFYVVNSSISRYILSTKSSIRRSKTSKKNQRVELSFFRLSNSIIKEYDLFKENVMKKISDTQFSIQKKWNDNNFTNHVLILKTMLRVFMWRTVWIFRFESHSWIVFFFLVQKYNMKWKYEYAHRRLCELSSISNYLNLFCVIHVLNFRCDLFISST
jgi:hypothetical protein